MVGKCPGEAHALPEPAQGRRVPARGDARGIVITDSKANAERTPAIAAFIWGGRVRPRPTLPYGRWKGAA